MCVILPLGVYVYVILLPGVYICVLFCLQVCIYMCYSASRCACTCVILPPGVYIYVLFYLYRCVCICMLFCLQVCIYICVILPPGVYIYVLFYLQVCMFETVPDLHTYIDPSQLTDDLAGSLKYDHKEWIQHRAVSDLRIYDPLSFYTQWGCSGNERLQGKKY